MGGRLRIGAFGRPHPASDVNGDGWTVERHEGRLRVALIDGLGHGPDAAAATDAARSTLAAHPADDPVAALRRCHDALHATRGAAISIALLDPEAAELTYAGVGNVEARLWDGAAWQRPIVYRGIVGASFPSVRAFRFPLAERWLLLMHTDGVQARAEPETLPAFAARDPDALAAALVERWGRSNDDATALVLCPP